MDTQNLICFSIRGVEDIKDGNEISHEGILGQGDALNLLLIRYKERL